MIILSISPVVIDSQTPSIPSRFGNISTGSKYQYASTLTHVSAIFTPPSAEFDFIHFIRHNPGVTQAKVREQLKIDKGAAARRAANLESKGYLYRKPNPEDGRSQLLYATEKAEQLKNSKASIESVFYEWLLAELPKEEKAAFLETLDKLYWRSKEQRRAEFCDVSKLVQVPFRSKEGKGGGGKGG